MLARLPPLRRTFLVIALVAAGPVARAALPDMASFNPFATFETRCEALPPARIEVTAAPITFIEDHRTSLRTLSRHSAGLELHHRTVGLTEARLGYETTLESKGLEDHRGGRVCARPNLQVVFSATPMTVYIAREFADDPCRRVAIRAHEMKHVAVYREYLDELVERLRGDLPGLFGSYVVYATDARSAQDIMRRRLHQFMVSFMRGRYDELKQRQAEIDTPEEYARLERGCGATQG